VKKRVHVLVKGRVQGVFYRQSCKAKARILDIVGFAKNLPDGTVETVFEGEEEKVEEMIAFAKKGTPFAKVEDVTVKEEEFKNEFNSFEIR